MELKKNFELIGDNNYMGYNPELDDFEYGTYEELIEHQCTNISFDLEEYESDIDNFMDYLQKMVKRYEKREKTDVLEVVFCGNFNTWNKHCYAGRVVDINDSNTLFSPDCSTTAYVEKDTNEIIVKFAHHDDTHYMNLYFITEPVLKELKCKDDYDYFGTDAFDGVFFNNLHKTQSPLHFIDYDNNYNPNYSN